MNQVVLLWLGGLDKLVQVRRIQAEFTVKLAGCAFDITVAFHQFVDNQCLKSAFGIVGCHHSTAHFVALNPLRSRDDAIGSVLTIMGKSGTRLSYEEPA